ncbi:hypothetical protein LCGC14_1215400 [marine sediment metagenome]|uniref:DNA-directed DNA polymerase n=1 Tax=marine sediment metagenome TaxID=412755 RepID=A0A0F9LD10_9ZZZZ
MLITSSDQLRDVVARLAQYPAIAFDLETTGLYPAEGDKLCMASMYYPTEGAFSVAWRMHGAVPNLPEKTIKLLQPLLDTELVGHNIGPFDLNFLRREGLDLSGARVWDTLNGALLFNDSLGGYKLSVLCTSLLNDDGMERSARKWELWRKNVKIESFAPHTPLDIIQPKAEDDVVFAWRMREFLEPRILERGDPYPRLLEQEMRWAIFLGELQWEGIGFDIELAEKLLDWARHRQVDIQKSFWEEWRPGLLLNSPAQLMRYFNEYHKLGIPNTEDWILRMFSKGKPDAAAAVERVLEHRLWSKTSDTFLESRKRRGWLQSARRGNGRVRASWGTDASTQKGRGSGFTRTLRLRCSQPNLQQVPVDDERYHLRSLFRAGGDDVLAGYDYSQIEVRFAAHYANETRMLDELRDPKGDIHAMVCRSLGWDPNVPKERYRAKRIDLGTIYNIGRSHLAQVLTEELLEWIDEKDTDKWLKDYRARYPRIGWVSRKAERTIQKRGYLTLWNGRRVHFNPDRDEPHKAFNLLIQTGVAEVIKEGILTMKDIFAKNGMKTRIVHQLHDEIITEGSQEELMYMPEIKRMLESIGPEGGWRCPLFVNDWHRQRWGKELPQEVT